MEDYYQEIGRAGRDNKPSRAILVFEKRDIERLKEKYKYETPTYKEILKTFKTICNYFQISNNELPQQNYFLDLNIFCHRYKIKSNKLKIILTLLRNSQIMDVDAFSSEKDIAYRFKVSNLELTKIISSESLIQEKKILDYLVRFYGEGEGEGVCYSTIEMKLLVFKTGISKTKILFLLEKLTQRGIIEIQTLSSDYKIRFKVPRENEKTIERHSCYFKNFLKIKEESFKKILAFYQLNTDQSYFKYILEYFGEYS